MKRLIVLVIIASFFIKANAQERDNKYFSLAFLNTENAKPFGKFAGLFQEIIHPGLEAGYGNNIFTREHHEWFVELKFAYFYHRFVQHGIPVYLNFGYRYMVNKHFSAETSIGAGYMHSIPATAQLKLNDNGDYVKHKGLGRMQAMVAYSLGFGYVPNPSARRPIKIFSVYQQRIQMPFVKSYVPLLPYNSFMIGVSRNLKSK